MPAELVPLLVRIRVDEGNHKYPEFNVLPGSVRANMDWSHYIDRYGLGWHYDKLSGFGESDAYNPDPLIWIGCLVIPKPFADAAVEKFPELCKIIDEDEFEKFYDDRAHGHEEELTINDDRINAIGTLLQLKKEFGIDSPVLEKSNIAAMLDPDHPTPGVHRNHHWSWELWKKKTGTNIHRTVCKHRARGSLAHASQACKSLQKVSGEELPKHQGRIIESSPIVMKGGARQSK